MAETTREFRANPYAGYVDVLPAKRLANAIATVKAVLIGLSVLGTILLTFFMRSEAVVVVIVYGFVSVVLIYVTFGWLEQTLRLLIGIAYNTAESADLMAPDDPSAEADVEYPRAGPAVARVTAVLHERAQGAVVEVTRLREAEGLVEPSRRGWIPPSRGAAH
jgi:hypothetical protein